VKSQSTTFYVDLLSKVLCDADPYSGSKMLQRDIDYIRRRAAAEGISFLTKTLPAFGKHIVQSIERGAFTPFPGFRALRGGLLPTFLQGWTKRIFHCSGNVLPDIDPYYLQEVLQIAMLFYKLETGYSMAEQSRVVDSFIKNEELINEPGSPVPLDDSIVCHARRLLNGVLDGFDSSDIEPGHGPGAVATGEAGNDKYSFKRKYQRLHQEFPYYRFFSPSLSSAAFESGWYRDLECVLNAHAKVTLVPKDSRGPRLISMEPLEIQWIQQGIMRKLVPHIERSRLIRGRVNFTDQTKNQQAALNASKDKSVATIDLKDASDRVSLSLVRQLFPADFVRKVEACRSVATVLPSGAVLPLKKFAPMGSALCFPVLSLTIWSLTVATLVHHGLSAKDVLVYGDDLIIPVAGYSIVVDTLHAAGLLVNQDKSFIHSHFRESCGMDAYNGVQVTPLRVKKSFTGGRLDPQAFAHFIELSEAFFNKGFWKTCEFLRQKLKKVYGFVPWTFDRSFPGHYCPDREVCLSRNKSLRTRYRADTQNHEVLVRVVKARVRGSKASATCHHIKGLLGLYSYSGEDDRVELRSSSSLRYRWCVT